MRATSTTWTSVETSPLRNVANTSLCRPVRSRSPETWRRWQEDFRTRHYGNVCVCVWESYACTYILYLHRQRQTYNRLTLECRTDHFTLEQRHNSVFICSYSDGDLTLIYPDGSRCSSGFLRMTIINFECNKSACKTQTCPKKIICLDIYSFLLTLALLYF